MIKAIFNFDILAHSNGEQMDVFLLPHQDDEIGILHMIDECVKFGRGLLVVYLTEGAWGRASAATRNAESRAALARLGVADDCIWFLGEENGIADQGLRFHLEDVLSRLLARLSAASEITAIYTPAWEGGHVDHDASALLAVALARKLRVPLHRLGSNPRSCSGHDRAYSRRSPRRTPRFVPDVSLAAEDDARAVPIYSDALPPQGHPANQHLDPGVVAGRPHKGALLYERCGSLSWSEFQQQTTEFRARCLD